MGMHSTWKVHIVKCEEKAERITIFHVFVDIVFVPKIILKKNHCERSYQKEEKFVFSSLQLSLIWLLLFGHARASLSQCEEERLRNYYFINFSVYTING